MKKLSFKSLLLMAALGVTSVMSAQMPGQAPAAPVDSAVITGKLDNGLTYYIRHNDSPKGQADFYIAQKVGSVLEEENQRGLAHFLEHMCFNGTEHFPGNSMVDWLESIGVRFGHNLNAYTSVDETVYNINNVPVARKSVQDSCLIILHDWACALTLDPEEINKERGVIHEEWRRSMAGEMRVIEKLMPVIYPDCRYGERLPIGLMSVVDNFEPQVLVDYYKTWYRPDQQGIIVVGDIDPEYIESKIKEIFGSIKMPENAKEREYFEVEDTDGTIYAIGADPECRSASFALMFKCDPLLPRAMRNSMYYYSVEYMRDIVVSMLNKRLEEAALAPDADFAGAGVELGHFFVAPTKEALTINGASKGNDILPAVKSVYREVLRAVRGGFTISELERARAEFLSDIERKYNDRDKTESITYAQQYVRSFIDNNPIAGIAKEYEIYNQIAPLIDVNAINSFLPSIVTDDNRVFMAIIPENEKFVIPTEAQVKEAIESVDAEEIEPYKDEVKSEPLIPALPAVGSVVAERHLDEMDATEWTLSNGIKVIVKPTEFKNDEITFTADAKGGTSVIDDSLASSVVLLPMGISQHGLGDYSYSDLSKYLQGTQVSLDFTFETYMREAEGKTTVKDLTKLMELIYMNFTAFTISEDEFNATRNMLKGVLSNQETTPNYIFSEKLLQTIYNSPKRQMLSTKVIDEASREATLDIVRKMLAAPTDFTFVFAGNIDLATLKPLVEQYIATIPVDASASLTNTSWVAGLEPVKGTETNTFTTKMQTPQSYAFVGVFGQLPYSTKNKVLTAITCQILSNRLLKKIREEMGATYSIQMMGDISRVGEINTVLQTAFPFKPETKAEVLTAIHDIIYSMEDSVSTEELTPAREYVIKNISNDIEDNGYWSGAIAASTVNGKFIATEISDTAKAITVDDVKAFMKELLDQNNYRVVILDPEAAEAPEAANAEANAE
ncbi:MAG: M16 family metallopeptidase [Muribaculaceae bacterium]